MKFQSYFKTHRKGKHKTFSSPAFQKITKQNNNFKKHIGDGTNLFKPFVWIIFMGMFCPTAGFSQQNLIGTWELIGRMCEDSSTLIPTGDSIQHMILNSGGEFNGIYQKLPFEDGEMTLEEFQEQKISRARERQDEDEENHERSCRTSDGRVFDEANEVNLCERREKEKLYDKWWQDKMRQVEEAIAEDRAEEENLGVCEMTSRGSWETNGNRITLRENSMSATSACGLDESNQEQNSLSGEYYFEDEDLYFVLQPDESSREFCGSSDWSAVFFRQ